MDELWEVKKYPKYMQHSIIKRNKNIADGMLLCKQCNGTGSTLYSTYCKCKTCNGYGHLDNKK